MTNWIEEDPKTTTRLKLGFPRTEAQRECFAVDEIVNKKVEMQSLGLWSFGPRGRFERIDFLKRNGRVPVIEKFDPRDVLGEKVAQWFDVESREPRVKLCEFQWLETVNRGDRKLYVGHRRKLLRNNCDRLFKIVDATRPSAVTVIEIVRPDEKEISLT